MKWEESANSRKGFTIVEVVIVLAITGLIFVGAVAGISSSLARQRFNDSVQTFAQTLRTQYDLSSRVQINERDDDSMCDYVYGKNGFTSETRRGRTDCNIYGVAVTLGAEDGHLIQSSTLLGKDLRSYRKELAENQALYNISDIDAYLSSMSTVRLLGELGVSNYYGNRTKDVHGNETISNCKITQMLTYEHVLWGAHVEKPNGTPAKYIILIVRSPRDGTIHTFYRDLSTVSAVTDLVTYDLMGCNFPNQEENIVRALKNNPDEFKTGTLDLCLDSEDVGSSVKVRRTIKLAADGHGSSAVELVDVDQEDVDNICAKCDEGELDRRCEP